MQPWRTPFPIWNQSVVPCPVLTVASWPAYRFLKRQVRWSDSHLFLNFPQFIVIHTVEGFGIVNKAEIDAFLELSCFSDDLSDVGNLISGSSAFSKTSLNIWKFMIHVLLKPGLENFEHYFTSVWDDWNCVVVLAFFGIAFLRDSWRRKWHPTPVFLPGKSHRRRGMVDYSPWGRKESDMTERLHFLGTGMKTDLFQSCGYCWVFQICWHIECSTFTASSFRIWNSSTGIPSHPLALLIVMLSKAYLTAHSRMSGSSWVITPLWLAGSWRSFLYSSSMYSCHIFLISSASVRSIPVWSFIEPIFAWDIPLISLIFLKRALVFPILLFSSISLHWSLRKAFLSLLAILWNSAFK